MDVYYIHYGTCGFRFTIESVDSIRSWTPDKGVLTLEDLPPFIIYRCGIALNMIANSNLDSCNYKNKFVGSVITASHNHHKDNGIKLFGFDGLLINEFWENELEKLVNCRTNLCEYLIDSKERYNIRSSKEDVSERVILIGRDNRETGPDITKILISGICFAEQFFGKVKCIDLGLICTATLAWCVKYGNVDQQNYYLNLSNNWDLLTKNIIRNRVIDNSKRDVLVVDAAQGPFSTKIDFLRNSLIKLGITTQFYHCDHMKHINYECGSNYLTLNKLPREICYRCVSFDGDADRLIYYIADDIPKIADGDYILCLIVKYIAKILSTCNTNDLTLGVIQTRYSNISSTNFILDVFKTLPKNIKCKHIYTDTGVKHLKRASHSFDIAIFYESNGHGELVINNKNVPTELILLSNLSNIAMGDSVSNCLMVEACLYILNLNINEWLEIYKPIPSILSHLPLDNKYRDDFIKLLPEIIKSGNDIFSHHPNSRFLVRLSGTESCIRIFVESDNCVELLNKLEALIKQTAANLC